ncbi:MAG: RnfABCDGE type electron transport complex subunit D, partial [Gammaproteobacteria bacterium]
MNRVSTAGPFQFLAGTSQRRDLEITWALIPALVFHAWAVGIHSIVVLATCLGVSLATAAVSSVAGGKSIAVVAPTGRQLLVLIIPILLLPASAPLWSAIGSILLAIWLLRGVFGAANPVFNPAALALLFFVILSGPGSLPATPDFSAIPIYLLSDGYLQYLWDGEPMAI